MRIDDRLHSHPKVRRAGAAAVGIWATAGSFSMAYQTDGFVPRYYIDGWGRTGHSAAARLVEVGLWEPAERDGEQGWRFHDWSDYQPLSDDISTKRERGAARARRYRLKLSAQDEETSGHE